MSHATFQWAVIGAGPAGIAAVGRLMDHGISVDQILWIDPNFSIGDLGRYWSSVSSNTTVQKFLDFLAASPSFGLGDVHPHFSLYDLAPEQTCLLQEMVIPLQWVTNHLRTQIRSVCGIVDRLALHDRCWHLTCSVGDASMMTYQAKHVILATGAEPQSLNYTVAPVILPFECAIDRDRLAARISSNQTIAVFGSSHSAMIVIRHLVALEVKKIINFYRSPCRYAIDQGDWILFDNTGLKGDTALWAREHIDGVLPDNLERHLVSDALVHQYLPICDAVIYAVGFSSRQTVHFEGYSHLPHDTHYGIMGPGLFGLGIGFPSIATDPFGHVEEQVGLWKFMMHLNRVLPIWLQYLT